MAARVPSAGFTHAFFCLTITQLSPVGARHAVGVRANRRWTKSIWRTPMRTHRTLILGAIAVLGATANWPAITLADSNTQTDAATPDFSGIWGHPYWPSFEPPASGPGPVTNRMRLRSGVGNPLRLVGDYTAPILKPEAAEIVKAQGEKELSGGAPTPYNQCWPEGVPFIFFNYGMQMLQQPDKITILYYTQDVRTVRINQPHPANVVPSWHGDSVGRYEGDTLVIDTVGVKTDRPHAVLDMYGTPYSQALHVVERYRLIGYEAAQEAFARNAKENIRIPVGIIGLDFDPDYRGKHLQLQFTVEDGGVFTTPWSATVTYARPLGDWVEFICAENPYEYYAGKDAEVPRADKPDF
jgi:hypothetical protein